MRRLALIGFSGSGKTSLAGMAWSIGLKSADSDAELERLTGRTIAGILDSGDECGFRQLESEVISGLLAQDFSFLAFGGGVHAAHPVWGEILQSRVPVLYLRGSFDEFLARAADRPLLRQLGVDGYRDLYEKRLPLYERSANFTVDVSHRTLGEIWSEIETLWKYISR